MISKDDDSQVISKGVLGWLTTIGGIAAILFDIFSLFLDEKYAKQFAFAVAFIIPLGTYWLQHQRSGMIPSTESRSAGAADRLLKKYLAVYKEDRRSRIPIRRLRWIQKFASPELLKEENAQKLINASNSAFYINIQINLLVGITLIATLYAFLRTNFLFNPIDYAFGREKVEKENPFISLGKGYMIFGTETSELDFGEQTKESLPIDEFSIQKTEVTNHQYRICRRAGSCSSDPILRQAYDDTAFDTYPVVNVTAQQASEFCHWLGGSLPTSEQWERASRGLTGAPWPWGQDQPSALTANLPSEGFTPEGLKPADSFHGGASREGVLNLAGNAWEWTGTVLQCDESGKCIPSDWDDTVNTAPLAVRGGAWNFQLQRITQVLLVVAVPEEYDIHNFVGFRCSK